MTETDPMPRWEATGLLRQEPVVPLILPVRDVKVLYGLKQRHYQGFTQSQIPHAHEYFVPMDSLTAREGDKDPALQALIGRAAVRGNFLAQDWPSPSVAKLPLKAEPYPTAGQAGR